MEALLEMLSMFKLDEVFLRQVVSTLVVLCGQDGEKGAGDRDYSSYRVKRAGSIHPSLARCSCCFQ